MKFDHLYRALAAFIALLVIVAIYLNVDLGTLGSLVVVFFSVVLMAAFAIEWRARSKRFGNK